MASSFIEDDGVKVWQPRNWPRNVPLVPQWQDELFPSVTFLLQDSSTVLWTIRVTDAGILTSTSGSAAAAIPNTYLNDLQTDATTWRLGITTAGILTTTSVTFDADQTEQITMVSSGAVTWYLHITSLGILRTDKSGNWVQLSGAGLVDKLVAIRVASQDIQPAPGTATTNNLAAAYWDADSFQNDQLSQITLSSAMFPAGAEIAAIGAAVRMGANGDMYAAVMALQSSVSTLFLYKFLSGVLTVLGSQVISGVAIGDVISCQAQATTISALYNGDSLVSVTDASITSGQPGVYAKYTTTGDSTVRGDDWNAGQFSGVSGELISYQDATLTSAYNYQIGTRIRRGIAGSTISAHAIGSQFLRLDEEVAEWDYDPQIIGQLVFFKFTSFNLRGMQEENIANVTAYPFQITGESLGLLTPAHATYRPTSNPLTATDAGTTATISIASFDMRIPGISDITINSGSISGTVLNTLYYIYYDDPGFVGGTVAYQITTDKETALNGAGRFFVGSIFTPQDGAQDTAGNNDGGSGAQYGSLTILGIQQPDPRYGVIFAGDSFGDDMGTVTNQNAATDGDSSTYAELSLTGAQITAHTTGPYNPAILWSGGSGFVQRNSTGTLKITAEVTTNTLNNDGGQALFQYTISQGLLPLNSATDSPYVVQGPQTLFSAGAGSTMPKTTFSIALNSDQSFSSIGLRIQALPIDFGSRSNAGILTIRIWDIRIEYTQ